MLFFIFECCLLPEKFSICPKNNGFARAWGLQSPSLPARTPIKQLKMQLNMYVLSISLPHDFSHVYVYFPLDK